MASKNDKNLAPLPDYAEELPDYAEIIEPSAAAAEPEEDLYKSDLPYLAPHLGVLKTEEYDAGPKSAYDRLPEDLKANLRKDKKSVFAAATGAARGVTLGFNDEVAAALKTAYEAGRRSLQKVGLADDDSVMLPEGVDESRPGLTDFYAQQRDGIRSDIESVRAENPKAFLAGEVAGAMALPTPKIAPFGPATTMAGGAAAFGARAVNAGLSAAPLAAAAGLGNSEANTVGGLARDTAVGGGVGLAAGAAGQGLGEGLMAAGRGARNLAERAGFRAIAGKSMKSAAEEAAENAAERWGASGKDVDLDEVVASEMHVNRRLASQALDQDIVGFGRGQEGLEEAAIKSSRDAVKKLRDLSNNVDEAKIFAGKPQYKMSDEAAAEAMETAEQLLQSPDPLVRASNRRTFSIVKKYVNELAGPPASPQGELFKDAAPAGKVKLRDAWDMALRIREEAQKKDAVGKYVLNDLADNLEIDLMQQTQKMYGEISNETIGAIAGDAIDKIATGANGARNISKMLASKGTEKGGGISLATAGLAAMSPQGALAAGAASKLIPSMPRAASTVASVANAASKGLKPLGKAIANNSAKIGQTAAVVKSTPPAWEAVRERLSTNPDSFGPYAKQLKDAAAKGDKFLALAHYMLSQKDPGYQQLIKNSQE